MASKVQAATSGEILTTFELFPKLPIEICFKIWEMSINDISPRYVIAERKCKGAVTPGILQACRESRKEARKKYARHEERDTQSGLYAWFVNYEIDTIFLNRGRPFQLPVTIGNSFQETPHGEASEPEWLGVVQKVAFITHGFLERYFQYRHGNLWGWLLKTCPQLKELSYVTFAWFEECTTFEGSLSNVVEVPEIWNGHHYYPQNLRIILRDELTEQQKINGHKTDLKLMWIDLPEAAGRNQQEVFEEEFKQMA